MSLLAARLEMELMEKVKQVGESYELSKLKTQNRTIELDARLASERLFATKIRLHQMHGDNEKLNKQLRLMQQHMREQEKKLLLTETMLRQFVDNGSTTIGGGGAGGNNNNRGNNSADSANLNGGSAGQPAGGATFAFTRKPRLTGSTTARNGAKLKAAPAGRHHANRLVRFGGAARKQARPPGASAPDIDRAAMTRPALECAGRGVSSERLVRRRPGSEQLAGDERRLAGQPLVAVSGPASVASAGSAESAPGQQAASGAAAVATQTSLPSRARTIINDLRQRLNLGSSSPSRASGK